MISSTCFNTFLYTSQDLVTTYPSDYLVTTYYLGYALNESCVFL